LWANLVDADGVVISSVDVKANGTYELFIAQMLIKPGMNYSVILTNSEHYEGDILTSSESLANDYFYTGTNYDGIKDSTNTSGIIELGEILDDIINVNFGLNKYPEAVEKTFYVDHTAFSTIPLTGYPTNGSLAGSDPEDCAASESCNSGATFKIHNLNPNTILYYDFKDGNGPVIIDITAGPVSITNFNPDNLVIYVQHGTGDIDSPVGFEYSIIDAAGFESEPVTYTIISDIVLAHQTIHFSAQLNQHIAHFTWSLMLEDIHSVQLEYSTNLKDWTTLQSFDNSDKFFNGTYQHAVASTNNYYRLAIVNAKDQVIYSEIKLLTTSHQGHIIYPNPVKHTLYIKGIAQDAQVYIYYDKGQLVHKGEYNSGVSVEEHRTGQYFIHVHHNNEVKTIQKFIKL